MTLAEWLRARRPLWAAYPTRRLAVIMLCLAVLWLLPGSTGIVAGMTAAGVALLAAGADYLQLPGRRDLEITRDIPATLGLGDEMDAPIVITSHWPRPFRATMSHELPATFEVARTA